MKRTDFARRCAALSRLCAGWAADTLSCLDLDQDEGDQTVRRFIEDVRGRLEWIGNDLQADTAPVDGGSKVEPGAWRDVLAERHRQVSMEGWTPEHDDAHDTGDLALAASCYARFSAFSDQGRENTDMPEALTTNGRAIKGWGALCDWWPWDRAWWKPTTRRHDLVKAGALILAEIERLDRLPLPGDKEA